MYDFTELIQFMQEYTSFFDRVMDKEKDKLDALLSYDLKRMEHSISEQQAMEKQFQNMEKKREETQVRASVANKTFREIVALATDEEKTVLQELFAKMQEAVDSVKYYNTKSMEFVKMNMQTLKKLGYKEPGELGTQAYTQAGQPGGWNQSKSIFQKKI